MEESWCSEWTSSLQELIPQASQYFLTYSDVNCFSSSASSMGMYVQHWIIKNTVNFFFRFDLLFFISVTFSEIIKIIYNWIKVRVQQLSREKIRFLLNFLTKQLSGQCNKSLGKNFPIPHNQHGLYIIFHLIIYFNFMETFLFSELPYCNSTYKALCLGISFA